MKKIILLNGPARSGKDTLGTALAEALRQLGHSVEVMKFATPLKEATHRLYDLPYRADAMEQVKDLPCENMMGVTPRAAYIAVSEKLMKPLHGDDVFGRLLLEDLELAEADGPIDFAIVTDSGFASEAQVLVDHYGPESILVVQMVREGYSFDGDSRGYVQLGGARTLIMDLGPGASLTPGCVADLVRFLTSKESAR